MKASNWKIGLYVLAVFLSGVLVGGFSHRVYTVTAKVAPPKQERPKPTDWRQKYVRELKTRLDLSDAQVVQLNTILDETKQRYKAAHAKIQPEMKQIHNEQVERIAAMLTESQRPEYARFREERDKRRNDPKK